jgi:Protein of unknown function (DUF4239)
MNTPFLSMTLLAILFIGLSQLGLSLFNRLNKRIRLPQNNEVAGIMFGAISLIYSLVLAFVIVAVWEDYDKLNQTIETEADKLNGIIAHSSALPDSVRHPLDSVLTDYCREVVDYEWKMKSTDDTERASAIPGMRRMLVKLEPQDRMQENLFAVLDNDLSDITELRRSRLAHSRSQVPGAVWLILKTGSIMLITFSYLFTVPSETLKRVYLFFLSGCVAMCMILVYTLDQPFTGNARVSNEPYDRILMELHNDDNTITQIGYSKNN